jgi:hypothetical protein
MKIKNYAALNSYDAQNVTASALLSSTAAHLIMDTSAASCQ